MRKAIVGTATASLMLTLGVVGCGTVTNSQGNSGNTASQNTTQNAASQGNSGNQATQNTTQNTAGPINANAKNKLIVVITPSHSNPFFGSEAAYAVQEAKKLGYKTLSLSSGSSPQQELNDEETAIADKASAVILDNQGANSSIAGVEKLRNAGIPSFLIDREINKTGVAIAQIVSNNFQGAALAGTEFAKLMHGKGNYVELTGLATDTNAKTRAEGFASTASQYPGMHMVAEQAANWSQSTAFKVMQSILQSHKNIQGVWCGNDTMALGAWAALKDAGMTNVIVGGMDGSNPVRDSIEQGGIKFTVMQPLYQFSTLAVKEANQYLTTGSTGKPEKQLLDCTLITSSNAKDLNNWIYTGPAN